MSYIDGLVLAVPEDKRAEFLAHAEMVDALFLEYGATRVMESWADDVPRGQRTDFWRAVAAEPGETVGFSWIEWPDKATRDAGMAKLRTDSRMTGPVPFDGKRMIFGGFAPLLDEGASGGGSYLDGFVIPVPEANKDAYRAMAAGAWTLFEDYGALRLVEGWGDDVPEGKLTDFRRAVKAEDGEQVVFSFIEWPDKATRDAGQAKMMEQEFDGEMPFDGKRMIFGGFVPVYEKRA